MQRDQQQRSGVSGVGDAPAPRETTGGPETAAGRFALGRAREARRARSAAASRVGVPAGIDVSPATAGATPTAPTPTAPTATATGSGGFAAGADAYAGPAATPPRRRRRGRVIAGVLAGALLLGGGGWAGWKFNLFNDIGDPVTYADQATGADPASAPRPGVRMPTGPKATFVRESRLPDGTEIVRHRLVGEKSGFTGDVWVWLPKEYHDPAYARSAFPVMIALPGGQGFPKNYWMGTGLGLQQAVIDGAKDGVNPPFILVMPVINATTKYHYDGSDIPGQPKMGTWMVDDVPNFAKANFRTFTSRDGWAFMGSSSGGFGALKHVLKYPDRFKAVIASGVQTDPDSPLWHGNKAAMDADNPEKLAAALVAKGGPDVWINFQIGTKEPGRDIAEAFMRKYGRGPVHTRLQVIQNGEHNGKSYIRGMREGSLRWISEVLLKPTPDPVKPSQAPTAGPSANGSTDPRPSASRAPARAATGVSGGPAGA
ncbi:alpha/beta hydrolase [Streptomyces sp. BI20]|uniref:alpha/beta hydrolase n=1 Tax=Streptomyces sp. BI20 TaxID=3403460 RepID=UPI003C713D35